MNFTEVINALHSYEKSRIVFVGLGNTSRGDDSAGLDLLERIKKTDYFPAKNFIAAERNPENYLEVILELEPDAVLFIDAADWQGPAGGIKLLDRNEIDALSVSTHAYSIALIENYLNINRRIDCFYLGIQKHGTKPGDKLSEFVQKALNDFFSA